MRLGVRLARRSNQFGRVLLHGKMNSEFVLPKLTSPILRDLVGGSWLLHCQRYSSKIFIQSENGQSLVLLLLDIVLDG